LSRFDPAQSALVAVLVLTTVVPGERRGGGEIVSQDIVDALTAAGRDVRVVGYARPDAEDGVPSGVVCAGRRPIETSAAGPRALAWAARALATGAPYSAAKYDSRAYRRIARDALEAGVDAVVADHAQVRFALRAAGSLRAPLVFVAHNAEARLYAAAAAEAGPLGRRLNSRESRLIGALEADLAARARQVWTLTGDDASYFRDLCPSADVRTLDVAVDARAPRPAGAAPPRCDVALIGTWSWRANGLGLEWFAQEVVPRLGGLTVEVAGTGCDWLRGRLANVAVAGVVPDAHAFLAGARAVAVPAVAGGGVQVKTLDAIASGTPVVATPTAVRALGDLPASVTVAEGAERFAAELRRLAAAGGCEALSAGLEWSAARRARFDAAVAGWIDELTEAARPRSPLAALAPERS
jgi:glycosyltransferase involved in cell wall biosynthesis